MLGRGKGFAPACGSVAESGGVSEGPGPPAVAREAPEPAPQRPAALGASYGPNELLDPSVPRLRQVRALRLLEDRPEVRRRREVPQGLEGRELPDPRAWERDPLDRRSEGESEGDRGGMGLPRDVPGGRDGEDQL